MKILLPLLLFMFGAQLSANELSNTFLKIPFGITLTELNKEFESRTDILFLDTAYKAINGNLNVDHWYNSKEELSFGRQHSGAYKCVIGKDTLGEIRFIFYQDKLYKVILDGSPNEKMVTKYFYTLLGKPKVSKKKIEEIMASYEEKYWTKNGMSVVLTLEYPNYPTIYLAESQTEKTIKAIEQSYRNFEIKGVIPAYNERTGKEKDSVLEWQIDDERVWKIWSECLSFKYFQLKGNLKDFSVILKCKSSGEVVYREDNINLNKKLKIFEDLNVWFDYCVDSEEYGNFTIDVIKNDFTIFHGEVTRNGCYE